MRTFLKFYFAGMALVLLSFKVAEVVIPKQELVSVIETQPVIIKEIEIETPINFGIEMKGHSAFLGELGHYESSNDYQKVNRLGYMGRYQFGKNTLRAIGIKASKQEFLNSPTLQEHAMEKLLEANYKSLKRYINKYEGEILHGVLVTESGVLAAAHLGGAGNVSKWFRKGIVFKDANGTPITRYMKTFSDYSLDFDRS